MNAEPKKDYRFFIITLILNGIGSLGNLIAFAFSTYTFRWVSLGLGIACSIALIFILTHKDYYIRSK